MVPARVSNSIVASLLLSISWITYCRGSHHVKKTLKQPYREVLMVRNRPPANNRVMNILGSRCSKPQSSLQLTPDCNPMR